MWLSHHIFGRGAESAREAQIEIWWPGNGLDRRSRVSVPRRARCNPAPDMNYLNRSPTGGRLDTSASLTLVAVCVAVLALLLPTRTSAQQSRSLPSAATEGATRFDLERLITHAESLAKAPGLTPSERTHLTSSAEFAKRRLELGDFEVGDRIAVFVQDHPTLSDTFAVRMGRHVLLPTMAELDLTGVLRSELQERVTAHVAQYIRDPVVRVTPLIRLSVVGAVVHPGYYMLPADVPLAELVMRGGGPTQDGDLAKVQLRRGGVALLNGADARQAISGGATIEQLNLRSGDEVFVGERRRIGAMSAIQVVTAIGGLAIAYLTLQGRHH